ncbi:MAG: carboxylate-amine ligase [Magnetospiraceae bacterium]
MRFKDPGWTIGIEEEYLLVDRETRDLAVDPPQAMLDACAAELTDSVRPEFLRSQIEVGTEVCNSIAEARENLAHLRSTIARIAKNYGLAPIAASTHPFAHWTQQKQTDKERYHILARDMQAVARRLVICGMHVHVGVEDPSLRIDLMNQVTYFLPHLLALSTSSPFWRGDKTGLKSYRICVFNELPRTGLPEYFESYTEYERHVAVLTNAGLIEDASMLWWDVRPSCKFPTLEMRITDVCTRLEDTMTIAALYVCILRMLTRLRHNNQRWRIYAHMLVDENRWRAQRYGLDSGLVDYGRGELVDSEALIRELLELIYDDSAALGCSQEVVHALEIVRNGTSAHRQIAAYEKAQAAGADDREALKAVVDLLIEDTVADL